MRRRLGWYLLLILLVPACGKNLFSPIDGAAAATRVRGPAATRVSAMAPDLGEGPSPDVAILTWNMNAGRGDLPGLLAALIAGRLTHGAPRDYIVLLQEAVDADGDPAPTLGRVADRHLFTFFSPVREFSGRVRGNAILSTLPLVMPRAIPLPRERQPRAAVAASVTIAGEALFVVSAHLENRVSWWRGGLFSDSARRRQAAALIRALPASAHGIVGGDMNTWLGRGEPAWKDLLARFSDTPPAAGTEATFRYRLALDHLFFDLPDKWRAAWRVMPDSYGSDHHPVLGELFLAR